MSETPNNRAFLFVIVTVALDMMGFGIIVPVLPSLLEEVMNLGAEDAVAYGGLLTATFAITNFFATPTLGNLSDRFGRRPVLLISVGTLALDFLIMGLADSILWLLVGRALSGASAATASTAKAYIADVTAPEDRGKAFGMLGAAFGLGFIIGPAIGAALSALGPRAPFFAAAALAMVNFCYGMFVLPESLALEDRRPFEWSRANPFGAFRHFRHVPQVKWFIIAMGIHGVAHTVYPSTWNFHGRIRYGWEDWEIGLSLTLVGVAAMIVQALLIGRIMKRLGPTRTAMLGMGVNILTMLGFALAFDPWMAYALIPLSAFGGLVAPSLNTLMSNVTPSNAQGELHGATASLHSLAMIVSPVLMTQTLHHASQPDSVVYFPGAAFLLAAGISLMVLIPFRLGVRANEVT